MKKVALVTGGARGIGFGISKRLAEDGFDIAVFGTRAGEAVEDSIGQLDALGSDTLYICGDIADADACEACVESVIGKYGRIDVLVNNSGVAPKERADILEVKEESLDYVFGINIKGTFFMTQSAARRMVGQGSGIIVNISSISAYAASANRAEYCISKSAVSMMTSLFAGRLASDGIFVYEVRPGIIRTDMTAGVVAKYDRLIAEGVFPIPRWGYPEDVAKAVSLLASGMLPYSTGEVINVDGGFHLRNI